MPANESLYNYLHSKTKIVIERAFGSLKNRFRIFKSPLNQKADVLTGQTQTQRMAAIIESSFILHNILIDLSDDMNCNLENFSNDQNEEQSDVNAVESTRFGIIVRDQVKKYLFTNRDFLQQ
jgi:hypothetical protein